MKFIVRTILRNRYEFCWAIYSAMRTGKSYFDYFEGYKCGNMFGAITLFP